MLRPPGSMDDGRRRTVPAPRNEAAGLHRGTAGLPVGNGCGNGSPMAATLGMAAHLPGRFRRAAHPDPAPGWPRSAARYKGARASRTVALTDLFRKAARDTSRPRGRYRFHHREIMGDEKQRQSEARLHVFKQI